MNVVLLKLKRAWRVIKELPLFYIIFIAVLAVGLFYIIYTNLLDESSSYIIFVLFCVLLYAYHEKRRDYYFIRFLHQSTIYLCLIEYMLISLPFLVLLFITKNYLLALYLLPAVGIISCIPKFKQRNMNIRFGKLFISSVEWKAGVRGGLFYLLFIYILCIVVSFFTEYAFLIYLLTSFQCSEFYRTGEPVNILCLPEQKPSSLIFSKLIIAMRNYLIVSIPYCLFYCIVFPSLYWVIPLFMVCSFISFAFVICMKYMFYIPNNRDIGNNIVISIGKIAAYTPIAPFILIITVFLYFQATKNLKFYLHDFSQ